MANDIEDRARALLEKFKQRPTGRGRKVKGSTRGDYQRAAHGLLTECTASGLPAPAALLDLLQAVNQVPASPSLTANQRRAVDIEVRLAKGTELASPEKVAAEIGVKRQSVYNWRRTPEYEAVLNEMLCLRFAEKIDASIAANADAPTNATSNERDIWANWAVVVRKDWSGPTRSPIDGVVYPTAEAFIDHVSKFSTSGLRPVPPDVKRNS